ncbi:hypothetical protein E1211_24850 [Micromonospora sp. 15K316]|uniref:hypothetical protein n=1 Tax=Micromonospora sp. 15K316 TaxID=2530376 RepID=UPI00104F70A0|nr:hypothetical protein [Micromonospora sp. 15K316]TDC30078.1 hypothetical protein E1211_24850 [Micromonospora sp. 15K316]
MTVRMLAAITAFLGAAVALTVAFAAQKLTGVVAWSWWVVAAPLLTVVAVFVARLAAVFITEFPKAWKETTR